jgi:hypothetical protein
VAYDALEVGTLREEPSLKGLNIALSSVVPMAHVCNGRLDILF